MPLTMKIPLYRPQLDIEDEAVALKVIWSVLRYNTDTLSDSCLTSALGGF